MAPSVPHAETINEQFRNHLVRNGTREMQTRTATAAVSLLSRRMLRVEQMKAGGRNKAVGEDEDRKEVNYDETKKGTEE